MKSLFDFIGRTEIEKYSRLPRNAETGDSDKEVFLLLPAELKFQSF
ncbi:hypothetical protein M3172_16880 [Mesobacillus subterraneus]|nr:hypothetical protein [Mesobacillus subterraneus]MCM3574873.1 hypothetical protein [Mesobacillus subterraneus]